MMVSNFEDKIMALQIYRRHRKECEAKRSVDSKSGKLEEGRRHWKRCNCLIHVSGTIGGRFKRQSTGERTWEEAEAVQAEWLKAGSWSTDGPESEPVQTPPAVAVPARTTVSEALIAYLDKCKSRSIQGSTLAKYTTLKNQLQAYCAGKGYLYIDQLQVVHMDEFYGSWKDGKKGKAKKLERLRALSISA